MHRLVKVVLRELIAGQGTKALRRAMAEMASDPAIQTENAAITRELAAAETDGLADHYNRDPAG